MLIDASVPAGQGEVLENYVGLLRKGKVDNKAFIELNGRPMIHYVIEALDNSQYVRSITVAGITAEELGMQTQKPIEFIEGGDTSYKTISKLFDHFKNKEVPPKYIMNVSCDIPLITSEMVDMILEQINEKDDIELYYNTIWHDSVKEHYPHVTKVPLKLKEGHMVFGDIHVMSVDVLDKGERREMVHKIMGTRKKFGTIVRLISVKYFFKYIFGRLSIKDAGKRISEIFDINIAFILNRFPESCVDLDYEKDVDSFQEMMKQPPRKLTDKDTVRILKREDFYLDEPIIPD